MRMLISSISVIRSLIGLLVEIVLVESLELGGGDAHGLELAQEVVHFTLHELVTSCGDNLLLCVGADEVAQSALGVDDPVLLQVVVGARHGVGIDLNLGGEFTHARHFSFGSQGS